MHDAECPDIGPICDVRAEPPQQHHTTIWVSELRLLGELGLSEHLAVQAQVPLRIVNTRTTYTDLEGNPIVLDYENIHHRDGTLTGLGDLQLLLHAGGSWAGFMLSGRVGLSIPTGKVHEDPYHLGHLGLPHQHIQLGTGTLDPVLGVDAARPLGAWSLALFAQAQWPFYEGQEGYQAGARLLGGVSVARPLGPVTLRLGVTLAHERPERWHGEVPLEDGNRGRTDLLVGPGVTIPFATDWSASLDVGIRAWGQAVGAQLDMPLVVSLSVGRLVHMESGEHGEVLGGDVEDLVTAGEARPLEAVPGKWTVFDFWAPWCEACKPLDHELRELAARDGRVALRRVNVVEVDSPIWKQELAGVSQLPHLRVVDPQGRVVYEASGKPAELLEHLGDLLPAAGAAQEVRITVTEQGFEPERSEVAAGRPIRLVITRQAQGTCATDVIIRGQQHELPLGQPVTIELGPQAPGTITYGCSMNMVTGSLVVR